METAGARSRGMIGMVGEEAFGSGSLGVVGQEVQVSLYHSLRPPEGRTS